MNWQRKVAVSGHNAPIYASIAHGGFIYTSAGDRFVTRWDVSTGIQDTFAIRLDASAYCLAWLEELALLIIGCTNGTIIAIDPISKKLIWEHNFLGKALFSCVDCPSEKLLVLGDAEGNLLLVDYEGQLVSTFSLNCGKIRQLKHYDSQLFVACQDGTVRTLELPTFNETQRIDAHEGGVTALCYFPVDQTLLTGGKDAQLRLWDCLTEKELMHFPAHYQTIYGIERINEQVITVSMDKTIKIWNPTTWKVEQRIEFKQGGHNRSVNGCLVINDSTFATFSDDRSLIVWKEKS